jgi:hypothetical protein
MPKNLSRETIRKMRAVIKAILAEPEFYKQSLYPQPDDCGEVCCAAGWTVWLANPKTYKRKAANLRYDWPLAAEKVLGLGRTENKLFVFASSWPSVFSDMYYDAITPLQHAQAMAARWEHFIKTDGRE